MNDAFVGGVRAEREVERYMSEAVYAERVRRKAAEAASALAAAMKEAEEEEGGGVVIGGGAAKLEAERSRVAAECVFFFFPSLSLL